MEKKEESIVAWKKRIHKTAGIYDADKALSDFKLALKAEIEKRYKENDLKKGLHLCFTEQNLLSIIDEVKPLEK